MSHNNDQEVKLEKQIVQLGNVPERTAGAAASGRAKFLAEAARLRMEPDRKQRTSMQRAWQFAMAFVLVLAVLFAGGVGVVNAAQDSIPGDSLYAVKLLGEDTQLALTPDSQEKIDRLMQFATTRVTEMVRLHEQHIPIPARTTERMEEQIHRAMVLAAGLDDDSLRVSLSRIRTRLREQIEMMNQVEGEGNELVQQTQERLQERIRIMDESMEDPEQFRLQMQYEENAVPTDSPGDTSATPPGGKGPGNPGGSDGAPGSEPIPTGTPGPGKGPGPYGP
jgi:hypothetical protein